MTTGMTAERLAGALRSQLEETLADPLGEGAGLIRSQIQSAMVSQPGVDRFEYLQQLSQHLLRALRDEMVKGRGGAAQAARSAPKAQAPAPVEAGAGGGEVAEAYRFAALAGALGVRDAGAVNPTRLMDLAESWQAFALAVDGAVRTVWREIVKHASADEASRAPAPSALQALAASYAQGTGRVTRTDLDRALDTLKRLISGMLMGLADAGKQHAQEQVRVFAPASIKAATPVKRLEAHEVSLWRQYEALVEAHHAGDIQAIFGAIQQRLADYVIQSLTASAGQQPGAVTRG